MSDDLLKISIDLRLEAEAIIQETDFHNLFSILGQVNFVGSYALDLMFRPDIDVFVCNPDCQLDQAITKTKMLLDSNYFQTVVFANHLKYPFPGNWHGCYWELKIIKPERTWKFDVWYTAERPIKSIEVISLIKARLKQDPTTRLKILERKQALFDGVHYRDAMTGFKIYQEILGTL